MKQKIKKALIAGSIFLASIGLVRSLIPEKPISTIEGIVDGELICLEEFESGNVIRIFYEDGSLRLGGVDKDKNDVFEEIYVHARDDPGSYVQMFVPNELMIQKNNVERYILVVLRNGSKEYVDGLKRDAFSFRAELIEAKSKLIEKKIYSEFEEH